MAELGGKMDERKEGQIAENKNIYKRKLSIDEDCKLGRKLERVDVFGSSYFRDNYYEAFELTRSVIDQNEKVNQSRKFVGGSYDDSIGKEKLYNIITFCGDRGMGKTSVMDSVVKAIQCDWEKYENFADKYESEKEDPDSKGSRKFGLKYGGYTFECLEEIDVSLLDRNEDILDVILSKMLQRLQMHIRNIDRNYIWRDGADSNSINDVYGKFEKIYRKKRSFSWRMEHPYEAGESAVERLSDLAGSFDIREELQEFIPVYLGVLNAESKAQKRYLIISIDDLDMHEKAFDMLEQIHRYLTISNVIIYIAVSEREIISVCNKHFEKIYNNPVRLAVPYLEKVLPYSRRVYLPALYNESFNVVFDDNEEGIFVKNYLLGKIAEKTGVYYDGCGSETHFYEIGNLRTLLNLNYLLDSMKQTDGGETENPRYSEIKDKNFEKLRNDVTGRMMAEKLDDEQCRIFRRYYMEDFACNGEYIVEQLIRIIDDDKYVQTYEECGYSYGELLGALYGVIRKKQEYKPLVHCILAMSTIELTQNYKYVRKKDEKVTKKWKEYISGTICGSWGNQLFPKVKDRNGNINEIAYVKNYAMKKQVKVPIKGNLVLEENYLAAEKEYRICERLIDETSLVKSFEIFMMFFTRKDTIKDGETRGAIEIEKSKENDKNSYFISISDWECTFDFLGFVVNGLEGENCLREADSLLLKALKKYCCTENIDSSWTDDWEKELYGKIDARSMQKKYKEWDEKYKGMVLPIYSLDITYNILKRAKKRMEKELPEIIESRDVLPVIKRFYAIIAEYLKEEDAFYDTYSEKKTYFHDAFVQNPFINWFIGNDGKCVNLLPELFESLFNGFMEELVYGRAAGEDKEEDRVHDEQS